ncbi:MAG: MBL fold metallo-hydrolase [Phycisphaerales bacterium]
MSPPSPPPPPPPQGRSALSPSGSTGTPVEVHAFPLGPYETNCYIVRPAGSSGCWIIDASFGGKALVQAAKRLGATPELLILTHAHLDHIAGVDEVRAAYPALPILIHTAERHWLTDPQANLSALSGFPVTCAAATRLLNEGEILTLGPTSWRVLHTPGHSPGGIGLYHAPAAGPGILLAGDTLFAGSVGRSDFPGSDPKVLAASIREKLYTLPDDTIVYPGHGPPTTIGKEKRFNPFVRA